MLRKSIGILLDCLILRVAVTVYADSALWRYPDRLGAADTVFDGGANAALVFVERLAIGVLADLGPSD
jgi:hypothetical protein